MAAATLLLAFTLSPNPAWSEDGPEFSQRLSPPFAYRYSGMQERQIEALDGQLQARLPELARELGVQPPRHVSVVLLSADREADFFGPAWAQVPSWLQGFAVPEQSLIVVRLRRLGTYPHRDAASVAEHELVHLLLARGAAPYAQRLPRWFHEGVAMLLAREWRFVDRWHLFSAVIRARFVPLAALERGFPQDDLGARISYAESFSFVRYLVRRHGAALPARLLREVRSGASFEEAFEKLTGARLAAAARNWQGEINLFYRWVPVVGSSISLWGVLSVLVVIGYLRKRRKTRAILKRWEEEEGPHHPWDPGGSTH
ncbi:MAG: peptidase MA family metallohydrolase [Acidobacteriota bacterium]